MEGLDILHVKQWQPLATFGLEGPLFTINTETVIHTWIVLGIIALLIIPIKKLLMRKKSLARFFVVSSVGSLMDMCKQTLGIFAFNHVCFIGALFIFIFLCNSSSILPWLEEPTQDLNTTLALGIISFMYTQIYSVKSDGVKSYIKDYFKPFFVMLPLNIVGQLATIVSISFRLFGNIFGGVTIGTLYMSMIKSSLFLEIFGLFSGMNLGITIFFGLFEGFLQAFVFAMLTLTYLSIGIQSDDQQGVTQ